MPQLGGHAASSKALKIENRGSTLTEKRQRSRTRFCNVCTQRLFARPQRLFHPTQPLFGRTQHLRAATQHLFAPPNPFSGRPNGCVGLPDACTPCPSLFSPRPGLCAARASVRCRQKGGFFSETGILAVDAAGGAGLEGARVRGIVARFWARRSLDENLHLLYT